MIAMGLINEKSEILIPLVLVGLFLVVFVVIIGFQQPVEEEKSVSVEEGEVSFGQVQVEPGEREIRFPAEVQKAAGEVTFLLHLQGYEWLREESAIVSSARLADLQEAVALLDWALWDELWYEGELASDARMDLHLRFPGETRAGEELVERDEVRPWELIFFGSPYFDDMALETTSVIDCRNCPLYPLEKELIREEITGGESLQLRENILKAGKELEMIISIPEVEE